MLNTRSLPFIFVVLVLILSSPLSVSSQTLEVAVEVDPSTLDPHLVADVPTESMIRNIYSNLVRFNAHMEIVPDLAIHWSISDDGCTWTFTLRDGVTFHDGTPLDAQAVKLSFQRLLDPETRAVRRSLHGDIQHIHVVDELSISFTTERAAGTFLHRMAHPSAGILNPYAAMDLKEEFSFNPVGSGPFRVEEVIPGERVVLTAFPEYYKGVPVLSTLVMRVIPEASVRSLMLQSGEVDIALRVPTEHLPLLERHPDIQVEKTETTMTMYIAMNNAREPFTDVRVRQALNYAVDTGAIIQYVLNQRGRIADAPISPVTWGYSSTGVYEYDPEKAKMLLEEAGYADGLTLSLWTPVGRYLEDVHVAETIQAQLAEVGVTVKVTAWEFGAYISELRRGDFDMVLLGWSPSTADADWGLYPVFHSTQWPPASNRAHYSREEVDELLEAGRHEVDEKVRRQIYEKVQQIILDDAPWIFLWYGDQIVAHRKDVQGLEILPLEHILFEGAFKS